MLPHIRGQPHNQCCSAAKLLLFAPHAPMVGPVGTGPVGTWGENSRSLVAGVWHHPVTFFHTSGVV